MKIYNIIFSIFGFMLFLSCNQDNIVWNGKSPKHETYKDLKIKNIKYFEKQSTSTDELLVAELNLFSNGLVKDSTIFTRRIDGSSNTKSKYTYDMKGNLISKTVETNITSNPYGVSTYPYGDGSGIEISKKIETSYYDLLGRDTLKIVLINDDYTFKYRNT
jgi:hypothetical protein